MDPWFNNIYRSKTVLVTGHTGFKGSWLSLWLRHLGAQVIGYALDPLSRPNHWELLDMKIPSIIGDIRDRKTLSDVFKEFNPKVVFHLAAQPLVIDSYRNPATTFDTNIMGTVNLFEACRHTPSVEAVVVITSDKCYENKEWIWGYRENDPMGGHDPYSASKGCAELVVNSYRKSFFNIGQNPKTHHVMVASARAGNVVGGGDWADHRLIPDIMRAVASGKEVVIRNPDATRPWQHVLDPLCGYLELGKMLLEKDERYAESWNFGPVEAEPISVRDVVNMIYHSWPVFSFRFEPNLDSTGHEAGLLRLDSSKAMARLKWACFWNAQFAFLKTIEWYQAFYQNKEILSENQLFEYFKTLTQNPPKSR